MKTDRLYVDVKSNKVTPGVLAAASALTATPVVGLLARLLSEEYGIAEPFTITEKDDEAVSNRNVTRTIDRV